MAVKKLNFSVFLLYVLLILIFITSISYAWVSNSQASAQKGLKVAFVNDSGDIIHNYLFKGDEIYPGWSKAYHLRVKNFGSEATYSIKLDFPYDNTKKAPNLADVLRMDVMKGSSKSSFRLTDFLNDPIADNVSINPDAVHEFKIILSMDESAGNEYQLLEFYMTVGLSAEPVNPEYQEANHYHQGNYAGTEEVIRMEPEITPVFSAKPEVVTISEESIPEYAVLSDSESTESVLPDTSGFPVEIFLGIGTLFIGSGCFLKIQLKPKSTKNR